MTIEIICQHCATENVVIDNKLFFTEAEKTTIIHCSACNNEMTSLKTDGWFFVQSKEQYSFQLKIEEQKEKIRYVNIAQ